MQHRHALSGLSWVICLCHKNAGGVDWLYLFMPVF